MSNHGVDEVAQATVDTFTAAQRRLTASLREADLRYARKVVADAERDVAAAQKRLADAKRELARVDAQAVIEAREAKERTIR